MATALAVEQTGSGAPLVLLHGIAADSRIWTSVRPALAAERRVITVDLPGFGRSAPVGEPFDLVGHSLGGGVAIQFAAQHPGAVARLTLVAPAGLRPFPPAIANLLASKRLANLLSGGADAFLGARAAAAPLTESRWGRRLLLGGAVVDGAEVSPAVAREMLAASLGAQRTGPALAAITNVDLRPRLASITAQLGAIWGEADRIVPIASLNELLSARPDTRVVRLPDTGHVPMVERPEAFVAAVWRLLGDDPGSAGD